MKQIHTHITRVFFIALVLVAMTMSVQSQPSSQLLADGQRVYAVNCANCHGDKAQGALKAGIEISVITERSGKQPPDLTDQTWDHGSTDADIFKMIKEGMPSAMMPSHQGRLTDVEIQNVVSYLRSLASPQAATTASVQFQAASSTSTASTSPQSPQQKLVLGDFIELPITGDMSTDRVTGVLARGSILRDEPGGQRFFINDLNGVLYIYNKQTKQLTPYLNFDGTGTHSGVFPKFTAAMGYAAGLMNFVFDPDYAKNGIFYTLHMEIAASAGETVLPKNGVVAGLSLGNYSATAALKAPTVSNPISATPATPNPNAPPVRAPTPNPVVPREMVIVEWTDKKIGNTTFEGAAREVLRIQLPGIFHPLNEMIFNPTARMGDAEWRVMYLGIGDAGTGERPGGMKYFAQRLDTYQGKILRIIPTLSEHTSTSTVSQNGRYRIPNDNPFVSIVGAKKEIWALGLRNPHRLTWYVDPAKPKEPVLLAFNIGLVSWETVEIIKKGANYGYPLREGNQSMSSTNAMGPIPVDDMIPLKVTDSITRGMIKPSYPVAQYPHAPGGGDAIANGFVYHGKRIPALQGSLVFGDVTTGRIWYTKIADVLAADDGNPATVAPIHELSTTIRTLSEETYKKRSGLSSGLPGGGMVAGRGRIDQRLAEDNDGELYLLTKGDGMIRTFLKVE